MLSLHLLQVSLVYVNTLMIQQVLKEGEWRGRLTAADLRALSPLKWQHINPYGTFALNMKERLPLELITAYLGATLPKFRPSLGLRPCTKTACLNNHPAPHRIERKTRAASTSAIPRE
jgi:Tn3 transposase DDE domain